MFKTRYEIPYKRSSGTLHARKSAPQRSYGVSTIGLSTLPGYPRISLQDAVRLREFPSGVIWAVDLERMTPHLWIMSTQSSSYIFSRVFIKPLPRNLLSIEFWSGYLLNEQSLLSGSTREERETCAMIRISALGFLRTYYYLSTSRVWRSPATRRNSYHLISLDPTSALFRKISRASTMTLRQENTIAESSGSPGSIYMPSLL